jgi:hypothetical protein
MSIVLILEIKFKTRSPRVNFVEICNEGYFKKVIGAPSLHFQEA